ncbi:hypothetical protein T02_14088 [Trichinella nativa]|uniref:Uncharacterized protein n=1 Tax=Trichinella nativa TaxID=6335 RepID=A0A0V1LB31_9BILA|nr:hypothetical protein T02_14088 [Trichinella nativa]
MPLADRRSNSSILTFKVERRISILFFIGETLILDTSEIPTSPARKTRMLATKPLSLLRSFPNVTESKTNRWKMTLQSEVYRTRTKRTTLFLQTTKRKKNEATVRRLGLEDRRWIVRTYVCGVFVVMSEKLVERESERKGNPPINTGQSPNSDDRANNKVEEVNELARGSGSLQKMKA